MKTFFMKLKQNLLKTNHLATNFLLIIATLLFIQSTLSLFIAPPYADATTSFDIIIRTTLGSIFGYLISSAWVEKKVVTEKALQTTKPVIVVACITLFCLCTLLFARNNIDLLVIADSTSSTITQYRDFISAGIGALIGISKQPSSGQS